jgi:hypothetical protein
MLHCCGLESSAVRPDGAGLALRTVLGELHWYRATGAVHAAAGSRLRRMHAAKSLARVRRSTRPCRATSPWPRRTRPRSALDSMPAHSPSPQTHTHRQDRLSPKKADPVRRGRKSEGLTCHCPRPRAPSAASPVPTNHYCSTCFTATRAATAWPLNRPSRPCPPPSWACGKPSAACARAGL